MADCTTLHSKYSTLLYSTILVLYFYLFFYIFFRIVFVSCTSTVHHIFNFLYRTCIGMVLLNFIGIDSQWQNFPYKQKCRTPVAVIMRRVQKPLYLWKWVNEQGSYLHSLSWLYPSRPCAISVIIQYSTIISWFLNVEHYCYTLEPNILKDKINITLLKVNTHVACQIFSKLIVVVWNFLLFRHRILSL